MFRISSLSPYKGEIKEIPFTYDPVKTGRLWNHKDANGDEWDVCGFQQFGGDSYIIARPMSAALADGSYDTSGFGWSQGPTWGDSVRHREWIPYKVKIV